MLVNNFALSLSDGGSVDLIKDSENSFKVVLYDKDGNKTNTASVDVDLFVQWVATEYINKKIEIEF